MIRTLTAIAFFTLCCSVTAAEDDGGGQTLAQRLLASYEGLETIACEIRKTSVSESGSVTLLSRVYYKRPNSVHIQNIAPVKRLIVCDGDTLYYHQEGMPKGYSNAIGNLDKTMAAALKNIPGTPVEHLLKLERTPETRLSPDGNGLCRTAYHTPSTSAVLITDEKERLNAIEFFDTPAMTNMTGSVEYGDFFHAGGGCWIPRTHKGEINLPSGDRLTETRRIGNLTVNGAMDPQLFDPAIHFTNVVFVSEFRNTYGE